MEQPRVSFRYVAVAQLGGLSARGPLSLYYCSAPVINQLFADQVRFPVLQSSELDTNNDGKADRLEISLQMPLNSDEDIYTATVFVYHDVLFNGKTKLLIDSGSYLQYSYSVPMASLTADGPINFKQTVSLGVKGGFKAPYEYEPLFPAAVLESSSTVSAEEVSLSNILEKYASRNCK
jgi:hypothetical protein